MFAPIQNGGLKHVYGDPSSIVAAKAMALSYEIFGRWCKQKKDLGQPNSKRTITRCSLLHLSKSTLFQSLVRPKQNLQKLFS